MIAEWRKSYYEFLINKWVSPVKEFLIKYWYVFVLIGIFITAFQIRAINNTSNQLLDFDPIFQYRFTKYLVDWGHLPLWDELSYYVGRVINVDVNPPLIYYLTALGYFFLKHIGYSLMTTASFMSAIYGAMIVLPAFLLVRELSNKYGGLVATILIGTAPQILTRTFGSSFDTDQLVVFFLLMSLYAGYHAFKKRTIPSFCFFVIVLSLFTIAWPLWIYALVIIFFFMMGYFILKVLFIRLGKIQNNNILKEFKDTMVFSVIFLMVLSVMGFVITGKFTVLNAFQSLYGFAFSPETQIVTISIAELQPFTLSTQNLLTVMGGFFINIMFMNELLVITFILLIIAGFVYAYRSRDMMMLSFLLTLLIIGVYSTRSFRFLEFTSNFFLLLIGVGVGSLVKIIKSIPAKVLIITLIALLFLFAINTGFGVGQQLGPSTDPNWGNAWDFLKTQTPEFSLVGTWWDPGHMITGLAEKRVIADGAHCPDDPNWCLLGINTRISDLGKIMATTDENESLSLIQKYQGDSPKVYWIASEDLIGKYRWLQYFGTGCDGTVDQSCPLYTQVPMTEDLYNSQGQTVIRKYQNIILYLGGNIPIPIYIEGINGYLFKQILYYENGEIRGLDIEAQKDIIIQGLKSLESPLNFRFTNQTLGLTVWIPPHYGYLVLIPDNLRNTVFTKMFMLEGQGLEHFKQVFRNDEVKIYEVI